MHPTVLRFVAMARIRNAVVACREDGWTVAGMAEQDVEQWMRALFAHPELHRDIAWDVWALFDGRDTRGRYDTYTWWLLRMVLEEITEDELVVLAGPRPDLG